MSCIMCHMLRVMCQISQVTLNKIFFFVDKVVQLVGGGSVINGPTPCEFKTVSVKE